MSVGTNSSIKECKACGKVKQIVAFNTYKGRDGSKRRMGVCKKCRETHVQEKNDKLRDWRREYNASTRSKRSLDSAQRRSVAKKFVDEYKSRPCVDCGKTWPPVAMDLDHVRGEKVRNVSGLVSGAYKIDLIKDELEKCDVVCACCHRLRTATRKENLSPPRPRAPREKIGSLKNEKLIEFEGEVRSISEWARRKGISPGVVSHRLRRGYSVEAALAAKAYTFSTSPVRVRRTSEKYAKKLSAEIANRIRVDRSDGMTQQSIADKYGITQSTVSSIVLGKIWRPVELLT